MLPRPLTSAFSYWNRRVFGEMVPECWVLLGAVDTEKAFDGGAPELVFHHLCVSWTRVQDFSALALLMFYAEWYFILYNGACLTSSWASAHWMPVASAQLWQSRIFFFFVPWEGESPLAENQCLIRVVPPLLMLQIEPIVAAWKPAWPRPLGRPSRWNVWMMWRVSFPWTKQSAPFFHWFGEWVWGDSNVRKKDNAELMEGPGKMLPKDKLEVVAVKFYVLCEYHQGKAGSISDHARLLRGADFSQPNSWVRCDSMPPWGFLNLAAYRKLGMGLENLSSVSLSAWTATEPQLLRRENSCSLSVRMEWNVPEWCSGGRKRSSWLWAGRIECHSIPESP